MTEIIRRPRLDDTDETPRFSAGGGITARVSGNSAAKPNAGSVTRTAGGDSSITRVLGILDLFTPDTPVWTADMLAEHLRVAKATTYRYVRALCDGGFLVPVAGAGYVLGPRFIEFDRSIRLADPLLRIAPPVMADLRDVVNGGQLLCAFYGLRVLSVLEDRTDPAITMSMERGRPFPLFKGSPSRVILANLPPYQLRNLALHHQQEIAAAGLGATWPEFRDGMRAIRRTGYLVASDIDKALVGISAPIFHAPGAVAASLCLVRRKENVSAEDAAFLGRVAVDACQRISAALQEFRPGDAEAAAAFPISRVR